MNSVSLYSLRLKYQIFTPLGCKDKGTRIFQLVTKLNFFHNKNFLTEQIIVKSTTL